MYLEKTGVDINELSDLLKSSIDSLEYRYRECDSNGHRRELNHHVCSNCFRHTTKSIFFNERLDYLNGLANLIAAPFKNHGLDI